MTSPTVKSVSKAIDATIAAVDKARSTVTDTATKLADERDAARANAAPTRPSN